MKILKTIVISSLLSVVMLAQDTPSISAVMAKLENGLSNIQKGFLYNNIELIKAGVKEVQEENYVYQNHKVIKDLLPSNKKQMENAAILTSNRIDSATKELQEYLKLNQLANAHGAFASIVKACTDCHIIVRGW